MIKAQRLLINSLPDGARKKIAKDLGTTPAYVNQILHCECNPSTPTGIKVMEMAGAMAAKEIIEFSWDLKNKGGSR